MSALIRKQPFLSEPQPRFRFFLAGEAKAIQITDDLWRRPMPVALEDVGGQPHRPPGRPVAYGEYFQAIQAYLSTDRFEPLRCAMASGSHEAGDAGPWEEIRIYLEKHGQYYHPARVVVMPAGARPQTYVLNVALSAVGGKILKADFINLKRLSAGYLPEFLPQVLAVEMNGGFRDV